jgi:uncharacterized protein
MQIDFPYRALPDGRTATTTEADHIRDMIEQVLFTAPGERVNRPDFGCGLYKLIFDPTSPELGAALAFMIQGALQRWLGDVIDGVKVEVTVQESTVIITVSYAIKPTGEARVDRFEGGTVS